MSTFTKILIGVILASILFLSGYFSKDCSTTELATVVVRDTVFDRKYFAFQNEFNNLKRFHDSVQAAPKAVIKETIQNIKDKYEKANVSDTAFDRWVLQGADRWGRHLDSLQSQTGTNDTARGVRTH